MTIWFDVEDLIQYFQHAARPTGIQRLGFELFRAVWAQAAGSGEVAFCRRGAAPDSFRPIHFPALEAGIMAAISAPEAAPTLKLRARPLPATGLAAAARRLPPRYRLPLGALSRAVAAAAPALGELALALLPWRHGRAAGNWVGGHQFDLEGPEIVFAPGDWLVNCGAPWGAALYTPEFLAALHGNGARFALLVHDLIPLHYPEWCGEGVVRVFQDWLRQVLPRADVVFANSRSVARDVSAYFEATGAARPPPLVVPVGRFGPARESAGPPELSAPYVLLVGTIEVRKNHAAMLRVWRLLLRELPEDRVPDLVFAGKIGWLTADLLQQLENCAWLNGKIKFIDSPSEARLANLYRHCLFTVFPSLSEGWGLPVTESLSFGKTVAASNHASIPEAGGEFCAYFDPEYIGEAAAVIRGLLEHPERVAALEARIAREFKPPGWEDSAAVLLGRLGVMEVAGDSEAVRQPSVG
jgi:glycosyltransferase involved in cell wall biosynthesis